MTLKARYDAREDRMLLHLGAGDGAERRFWVTRQLWLSLYRMIVSLDPAGDEAHPVTAPPVRGKPLRDEVAREAEMLEKIKLARTDRGVRLHFAGGKATAALELPESGLPQLRRMLEVQADRAGWDTAAALERLHAAALAGRAVRRAQE